MILNTYDRLKAEGERKALQNMVIRLASRQCGAPDEATRTKIHAIEDVVRLENMVEAATTAPSWEQLLSAQ